MRRITLIIYGLTALVALLILLAPAMYNDGPGASKALEDAGYTNIHITGYKFFGCDTNDTFRSGFTAVGPSGRPVSGVVCSGLFKSHTIRTN
jgi:hypothetical protein